MALRKIVEQGDEVLNKVCRPVTEFNKRLHDLLGIRPHIGIFHFFKE